MNKIEILNTLVNSSSDSISLENLIRLSNEEFLEFCQKRYANNKFNINENLGKSFGVIHAAGWLGNIKAFEHLITLGADISKKSSNESTVLDAFINHGNSISNYADVEKLKTIEHCINILESKNFNFNTPGYGSYEGLYSFLIHLEKYENLKEKPITTKIIKQLITNTNLNSKNMFKNGGLNVLSALANTIDYFNPDMIDFVMSKNELPEKEMENTLMMMPQTDKKQWDKLRPGFYHFIRKSNLKLDNPQYAYSLINKCIDYCHKPLFQIATYNAGDNIDYHQILEKSIKSAFKYGITYVKKYNMQVLLDNKELINLAPDEKTHQHIKEQITIAQYQYMSKTLKTKDNYNSHQSNAVKNKI